MAVPAASRLAFTIIEALAALSVVAVCGLTVLMGLSAAIDATTYSLEQAIAQGMAQQLIDEIAGQKYAGAEGDTTLGPTAWEQGGAGRERFDDIDDYHNYQAQPPVDVFGVPLGQENGVGGLRMLSMRLPSGKFSRWRQKVQVGYASEANPALDLATGVTSKLKVATVKIEYQDPATGWRELARIRRVFAYVPPPVTGS